VATADRMKSHGKQSFHCFENDQSILYFSIPESESESENDEGDS
jgi:hypothetical protein